MGAEVILVKCFQMGGIAIVSGLVENGLIVMGKEQLALTIKLVATCGLSFIAGSAIWELMNVLGSAFL
jgi:hypothetical protein